MPHFPQQWRKRLRASWKKARETPALRLAELRDNPFTGLSWASPNDSILEVGFEEHSSAGTCSLGVLLGAHDDV